MAGRFLPEWFQRRSAPPLEVEQAVRELDQLAQARPALCGPIALLGAVLPRLYEVPVCETPPPLTRELASAKLAGGIPLLRGECWQLDVPGFWRRWEHVANVLRQHGSAGADRLATSLARRGLEPREWVQEVLAGHPESVQAQAEALGLDAGLAATALRLVLFPVLSHVQQQLAPLRERLAWNRGSCPTCGSWPLLGEFRGLEQTRFLRCGLCAAAWEFARLRCPCCDTRDHEQLGYLQIEGEEGKYRAAICKACRGYVKMVATLALLSGPQLLVADVATLHLDLIAAEQGFLPAL